LAGDNGCIGAVDVGMVKSIEHGADSGD